MKHHLYKSVLTLGFLEDVGHDQLLPVPCPKATQHELQSDL